MEDLAFGFSYKIFVFCAVAQLALYCIYLSHAHPLQSIPPSKYPVVLQQSLETDIFPQIIAILHKDYVE